MNKKASRHLITAALPYANGPIHIGHLAGCYLPADIYARFLRNIGEDVLFVSGTDEHGAAITFKALSENTKPKLIVDRYHEIIKKSFAEFGISFDVFSRTISKEHEETATEFFINLYQKGYFDVVESEQYYDEQAGKFLSDRYIVGGCPVCGSEAYGDQCEKCGTSLEPTELKNPRSKLTNTEPVLRKTKNLYLKLDAIAESEAFKEFAASSENWKLNVRQQFKSWLNAGLKPRAMTRDLDWGIQVPIEEFKDKVMYVWFDAPIGYISAVKEHCKKGNWEKWWCDKDTELTHFIGKDNIVFHTVIFPLMSIAHGGYILPTDVPANEFLNLEGKKISTSRNWAVWLHEYLEDFPGRTDELRYYLTSISPQTKDSDFVWKNYQTKVNSELIGILGNFVNRTVKLVNMYNAGIIQDVNKYGASPDVYRHIDESTADVFTSATELISLTSNKKFKEGLVELMNIARAGNKLLAATEPWKLIKTDPGSCQHVLNACLNIILDICVLCEPYLPQTSLNIRKIMNFGDHDFDYATGNSLRPFINKYVDADVKLFTPITDVEIAVQTLKLQA